MAGLPKFAGQVVRRRASNPKLQVLNTALMSAQAGFTLEQARADRGYWGCLVESAVGAHLANAALAGLCAVHYWRAGDREVDFVVEAGRFVTAIEVKSGSVRATQPGLDAFRSAFNPDRTLLVGDNGISLERFLASPVEPWVRS